MGVGSKGLGARGEDFGFGVGVWGSGVEVRGLKFLADHRRTEPAEGKILRRSLVLGSGLRHQEWGSGVWGLGLRVWEISFSFS